MPEELVGIVVRGIQPDEARVNVTWANQNGDLPDPVNVDAADGDIKQMVAEAVRGGGIPGIAADPNIDLTDFVVTRFAAKDELPNRVVVRPKTPFGVTRNIFVVKAARLAVELAACHGYEKEDLMDLVSQLWDEI